MSLEEAGSPGRVEPRSPMAGVRIVPARARVAGQPEFRPNGEWLEVTVSTPDIPEKHFRHAVGRRYLLVWADEGPADLHHFLPLPEPVERHNHVISFRNGVVDAKLRRARRGAPA